MRIHGKSVKNSKNADNFTVCVYEKTLSTFGSDHFGRFRRIDKHTGQIEVNSTLSYQMASVIVLTVRAVDANAAENVPEQFDEVEVTLFVKPFQNRNPLLTVAGRPADGASTLTVAVAEETPIGSELVRLEAVDVLTNGTLYGFQAVDALPRQIAMDYAGKVILTERLDYETLEDKVSTTFDPRKVFVPSPLEVVLGKVSS